MNCEAISTLDIHFLIMLMFQTLHLINEFNFWNVHGIINTSGLLHS